MGAPSVCGAMGLAAQDSSLLTTCWDTIACNDSSNNFQLAWQEENNAVSTRMFMQKDNCRQAVCSCWICLVYVGCTEDITIEVVGVNCTSSTVFDPLFLLHVSGTYVGITPWIEEYLLKCPNARMQSTFPKYVIALPKRSQ